MLIGMKWWIEFGKEGNEKWVFETFIDSEIN